MPPTTDSSRGYALITGASKGLGAEFAKQLAADKWDLILAARGREDLDSLAQKLTADHGVKVLVAPIDLSAANGARELWAQVLGWAVPVEVLVNNAGFGLLGAFRETALQRELEMLQVNVTALTVLTKLGLASMLERKRGFILNVASTAAFVPGPFMAIYYASKAYVLSFSEALYSELEGTNVHISVLCPGATRTEFAATAGSADSKLFKGNHVMEPGPVVEAGLDGVFRGTPLVIPGARNKLLIQSLRVSPRSMTRNISKGLQRPA